MSGGHNTETTKRIKEETSPKQEIAAEVRGKIPTPKLPIKTGSQYGPHGLEINGKPLEYKGDTEFFFVSDPDPQTGFIRVNLKDSEGRSGDWILVNDKGEIFGNDTKFHFINKSREDKKTPATLTDEGRNILISPDFKRTI